MIVGCSGWIIWLWNDKILVKKKKKEFTEYIRELDSVV